MKVVSIPSLALLALLCGLVAYGPLSNLWGYQDGSTGTYLLFGLPPLFVSLASLIAIAVIAVRR
jgi:hypothetical protein